MSTPDSVKWEQRWHPLREEWVVIAAHRQNRPWLGEVVEENNEAIPSYVHDCYLCPGNKRVGGAQNDAYDGVFVFDNDHPSVGPAAPLDLPPAPGIYRNKPANGLARVLCYSPQHNTTLAELDVAGVDALLAAWQDQHRELAARPEVEQVLIFENKGEVVGVSNPHPHCQIYACNFIFKTFEIEAAAQLQYQQEHQRSLFMDIIQTEREDGRRIIAENEQAVAFIPYFARYPYETYLSPKRPISSICDLSAEERRGFAEVQRELLTRYDNLWQMSFPYLQVVHNAPCDGGDYEHFQFYIQFIPPLRKPNVLKYLAGPEVGGGNFLNATLPEEKAAELQAVSAEHYKLSGAAS